MVETTKASKSRKPVYGYSDYREYLRDYFQDKKDFNPSFSYAVWARHLRIKSASTLIMIVNGQRDPGPNLINKLSDYFGFSKSERIFFNDLVRLKKVQREVGESIDLISQIKNQHPQLKVEMLEFQSLQAISQWYYSAIREMVAMPIFKNDPEWISEQLRYGVDSSKIKLAIESLLNLNLIVKDQESNRLANTAEILETPKDVASEAAKTFHEQTLDNAKKALREVEVSEREISGVTIPVRANSVDKAKKLIREFQIKFIKECEQTNGDQVYQLEVAFFPLTKKMKKGQAK